MHISTISSLVVLAFGAQRTSAAPPNGYSAFYSSFNRLDCEIQSWGLTTVADDTVGECINFAEPAISVALEELQDGCSDVVTFFPHADCIGRPETFDETGCINSNIIMMAAKVAC